MKTKVFAVAAIAAFCSISAYAQDAQLKWYGFVRNYFTYDTHASSAGTEDLYYWMPLDNDEKGSSNFVALSSRLGVDISGYEVNGYKIGAKFETDFYSKSGTTAILRLRQAYLTMVRDNRSWKIGQAWHPMAADMPDIFSLETGAPFGPFSRTPLVNLDVKLNDANSLTFAAIWQMQYTSTGPAGAVADYMKYSGVPELYLGWNYKSGKFLSRIGLDYISIKPYKDNAGRCSNLSYYMYDEYIGTEWNFRNKLTYATDGSHFNMVGGYGISELDPDGFIYSATNNVSDWFSVQYKGGSLRPALFFGYIKMLGTSDPILAGDFFWMKNSASSINQMYRIQPEVVYNLGKVAFGIEYMLTAVQYGKANEYKLAAENLHWVKNNRIQMMVKYTF